MEYLLNYKVSNFINIIFYSENWSIKIEGINYSFFYNFLFIDYTLCLRLLIERKVGKGIVMKFKCKKKY